MTSEEVADATHWLESSGAGEVISELVRSAISSNPANMDVFLAVEAEKLLAERVAEVEARKCEEDNEALKGRLEALKARVRSLYAEHQQLLAQLDAQH